MFLKLTITIMELCKVSGIASQLKSISLYSLGVCEVPVFSTLKIHIKNKKFLKVKCIT